MARQLRLLLVAATAAASAFKQFSNFKLPSIGGVKADLEARAKFGDKKLVVVTGTSSGSRKKDRARPSKDGQVPRRRGGPRRRQDGRRGRDRGL